MKVHKNVCFIRGSLGEINKIDTLAEWLRRWPAKPMGFVPREFKSLRCRSFLHNHTWNKIINFFLNNSYTYKSHSSKGELFLIFIRCFMVPSTGILICAKFSGYRSLSSYPPIFCNITLYLGFLIPTLGDKNYFLFMSLALNSSILNA